MGKPIGNDTRDGNGVPDDQAAETAKRGLRRAETGDAKGAKEIDQAHRANPNAADAAEQEAADGPKGRGLAR